MRIINLNKEICTDETVVGLGNFDGLHLGHQSLINSVTEISKQMNIKSSVILFDTHTNNIIRDKSQDELTSLDDKIKLLKILGIDIVFIVEFSDEFRSLTPEEFIDCVLIESCNIKAVVVGNDYTFGYKARGNVELLKEKAKDNYTLKIIDDYDINHERVSSSTIRKMIGEGEVSAASKLLGRLYSIKGTVIKGDGRGKKLGYPTANLHLDFNYVVPKDGVYVTLVKIKNENYFSLTSIGNNPTFDGQDNRIEVFIDDFENDIYGESIEVLFLEYIRPMIKFASSEELIDCMNKDFNRLVETKTVYNKKL